MKITIEGKEIELPVLFEISKTVPRLSGNKILLDKGTIIGVGAGKLKLNGVKNIYNPKNCK